MNTEHPVYFCNILWTVTLTITTRHTDPLVNAVPRRHKLMETEGPCGGRRPTGPRFPLICVMERRHLRLVQHRMSREPQHRLSHYKPEIFHTVQTHLHTISLTITSQLRIFDLSGSGSIRRLYHLSKIGQIGQIGQNNIYLTYLSDLTYLDQDPSGDFIKK